MKESLQIHGHSSRNEGFYDALENHLNNHHEYALLHFFHPSLGEIAVQETLHMAMHQQNVNLLAEFLKSHAGVSVVRQSQASITSRLVVTFTDDTTLRLTCTHRFQRKGLCYLSIDDLLQSRGTNGKRYVASLFFDFSFYVINQTLNRTALQNEKMNQFEQRAREEQIESIWRSTKNFWMNSNGTSHLASNVKRYIHALPMNNFQSRITYRLHDLMDLVKGLLRFPRITFPARENRLAPVPAATRTRRMPS